MGLFGKSCSIGLPYSVNSTAPDPKHFFILEYVQINGHTLVHVKYPNCTNYEGRKVILFKNATAERVLSATTLDPHFTSSDTLKPFARFEPTEAGWDAGLQLMGLLNGRRTE